MGLLAPIVASCYLKNALSFQRVEVSNSIRKRGCALSGDVKMPCLPKAAGVACLHVHSASLSIGLDNSAAMKRR